MKKFFMALMFVVSIAASLTFECDAETLDTPPMNSREELYQDIFVSLLSVEIEKAVNEYYKNVLNYPPIVYPYQVYIEKAERIGEYRSFEFTVIMKVYPVVGPHISVGLDRLTFYIGGTGQVKLKRFEHLRDSELPENWKHILKH